MLKSALFFTQTKDFLGKITTGVKPNQLEKRINIGKYEHTGIEIGVDSYWNSHLTTSLAYTYIDASIKNPTDSKDLYVTDVPRNSLAASLVYSPIASLDIIPALRYESERYFDGTDGLKNNSFTLVDLKVAYRPIKDIELSAGVKNLFDKNYHYDIRFPQEGRQLYANVRYAF